MAFCIPQIDNSRGDSGQFQLEPDIPKWNPPANPPASTAQEEAIRLQSAIESGDVRLAMEWASNLARRKIKLKIDIGPEEKKKSEEEIRVNIHIENKEISLGCVQLDVKPSFTITTLKLTVLTTYGFPPDIQKWIIGQQMANDESTLSQCGVNNSGASLFLYLVSAQSVGLTQEKYKDKYGHMVKQGIPGLPRSLSTGSNLSSENNIPKPTTPVTPTEARSIYMSMRGLPPVIQEVNEPPPPASLSVKHEDGPAENPPAAEAPPRPPRPLTDDERRDKFGWGCKVCTFKNWPTWPGCEMCDHQRPDGYRIPDGYVLCAREQERADRETVSEAAARERANKSRAVRKDRIDGEAGPPSRPPKPTRDFSRLDEELARQFNHEFLESLSPAGGQQAFKAAGTSVASATTNTLDSSKVNPLQAAGKDEGDGLPEDTAAAETIGHPAYGAPDSVETNELNKETSSAAQANEPLGHPAYADDTADSSKGNNTNKKPKARLELIGHPAMDSDESDSDNEFIGYSGNEFV